VHLRSGWSVRPYDFHRFEALYDLRLILEEASAVRFCDLTERESVEWLKAIWLVAEADRLTEPKEISALAEAFHALLVAAARNAEVARCHHEVTERIRIIRRLNFTQRHRIDTTYDEHGQILRALIRRRADETNRPLRSHIGTSKAEVRNITPHRLYTARSTKRA
jgi:DNA-binding GntR family transcriptional regulator